MDLPYLDMVISETLRKYPPLGFLDRIALQDYKVPNFDLTIEKDTPIFIPMIGFHHDPKYFPNPEKYDPLRFSENVKKSRPSFVYMPFGEGPHICIGKYNIFFIYLSIRLMSKLYYNFIITHSLLLYSFNIQNFKISIQSIVLIIFLRFMQEI